MKAIFSAIVALVLLGIYVSLVIYGIRVAGCISDAACNIFDGSSFTDRMASSLALIGGLVSALVIAELAVTKPGEAPAARLFVEESYQASKNLMRIVTGLYLIVWLLAGLLAFVFGYLMTEPDVLPALSDLGQVWLGIAVGAGYAYFGLNNPKY